MNNKGVTLIELLIVIVIIGIISAFAVPAVGRYLTNAQKSAVLQDAIAVRNAASEYCAEQGGCANGDVVAWADISDRISNFTSADYEETDGDAEVGTLATYVSASDSWQVDLTNTGTGYDYLSTDDPIDADTTDVTE